MGKSLNSIVSNTVKAMAVVGALQGCGAAPDTMTAQRDIKAITDAVKQQMKSEGITASSADVHRVIVEVHHNTCALPNHAHTRPEGCGLSYGSAEGCNYVSSTGCHFSYSRMEGCSYSSMEGCSYAKPSGCSFSYPRMEGCSQYISSPTGCHFNYGSPEGCKGGFSYSSVK